MKRKFNKNKITKKFYRLNERIFATELRVIGNDEKQIGVISKQEALEKAREEGLDLVEIAPKAKPPVAKIIDFNKFLYQEEKKRREQKRKAKTTETKEVRLSPFIDNHDLETRLRQARGFLEENNKVKLVVRFKGRQMGHPEFGHKTLQKAVGELSDVSKVDKEPRFEGRHLVTMLSPERKTSKDKKDQEGEGKNEEKQEKN